MRRLFTILFSAALLLLGSAQGTWAQKGKVYDFGHYRGGTWAELHDINNFGVAMGWGDVAEEDMRMLGVPVFGPGAGNWFECGKTSGASTNDDWVDEVGGISDTGLIVGSIKGSNGCAQAYAWTPNHTGISLGALSGDCGSAAMTINHTGTLIVGSSYRWSGESTGPSAWVTPVAWTPETEWRDGRSMATWKIHKLPTAGLEQLGAVWPGVTLNWWGGYGVNDLGQIVGDGWSDNFDEIAVVWNPIRNGKDWEVQQLPHGSILPIVYDHKYTEALSINNRGEIVGDANVGDGWCVGDVCTTLPALWKLDSPNGHTWKLIELSTLSGTRTGWDVAWGVNDLGDIVGVSNDADGNWLATRWTTSNPTNPKVLGFPGDWSQAFQVNNFGIAVGEYGVGDGPQQAAAVAIH